MARKTKQQRITQGEVINLLRAEGLTAGISSKGTISAFVQEPMFSIVAFKITDNKWGGWYDKDETLRWIADYRMTKAGKPQYEDR